MEYTVYVLINSSVREVFFGWSADLAHLPEMIPEEIRHWNIGKDDITNPVVIEESLCLEDALNTVRILQENALKNPQGRTILMNRMKTEQLS